MSLIIDGSNGLTFPNSTTQVSAGQVLQVVNATYSTPTTTTSTSFVTTNLNATITPKFATSKILILVSMPYYNPSSVAATGIEITLFRGTVAGTNLGQATYGFGALNAVSSALYNALSFHYQDSPATASAQTYTVGFRTENAGLVATICALSAPASITLMEIAQ